MATAAATPGGRVQNTAWLKNYRLEAEAARVTLHDAIAAQNAFNVQSMKVASQTDVLTDKLRAQKFGIRDLFSEYKNLNAVYKQQMAIRKSMIMQWGTNGDTISADLITPKGVSVAREGWRSIAREAGFYNQVLASVADQTVKWGKNTQWAGRQLTAGLSMPLAAAGAGLGALYYQLDKGLTDVVKVYGDAATAATTSDAQIREATTSTAMQMAKAFGQSSKDTIEITAQLAAAGKTGAELQKSTAAVTRARLLGELDLQDAMKATITLQSVYGMSAKDLGDSFNFMNTMENQTVLTMQDFVVGIPKISGVIKALDGDTMNASEQIKEMGLLLAGLKAAGIDAAEGANAIKSVVFKVAAPTAGAKDLFQSLTGKSYEDTMKGTEGVIQKLVKLGEAMKNLAPEDRVRLVSKLFGIYQGSKALQVIEQLTSGSEQMTRAFDVANQSTQQWGDTAARELDKLTNAPWNKFKQQVESIKISLAEAGKPFLEVGTQILGMLGGLIEKFNGLGAGTKKFVTWALLIGAAVGPLVMFTGLMANFLGSVAKMGTALVGLGLKFKIINKEEYIANQMAKQQTEAILTEADAYKVLALNIRAAVNSLTTLNKQQQQANFASALAANNLAGARQASTGTMVMPVGDKGRVRPMGKNEKALYEQIYAQHFPAEAAAASNKIAENASVTEKRWAGIKTHATGFAIGGVAAATTMATESGTMLNNLASAALIGSTILPLVTKISFVSNMMTKAGTAMTALGSVGATAFRGIAGRMAPVTAGLGTFLSGLTAAGPILAGVGIAGAAAWYVIDKAIKQTHEDVAQFTDSAKTYAEVIGYTYVEAGAKINEQGQVVDSFEQKVQKMRETNKGWAKELQETVNSGASQAERMQIAVNEGIKALRGGATKAQAEEAAAIALRAMGDRLSKEELIVKIRGQIDFDNTEAVLKAKMKSLGELANKVFNDSVADQGKREGIARFFLGDTDLNARASELVKGQAKAMWTDFENTSKDQQPQMFKSIYDSLNANLIKMFNQLQGSDAFKKAGINTYNDFLQAFRGKKANDITLKRMGLSDEEIAMGLRQVDMLKQFNATWSEMAGLPTNTEILNFMTLAAGTGVKAAENMMSVAEASRKYAEEIGRAAASGREMSEAQKLQILNGYRAAAGLQAATSSTEGFTTAVHGNTTALTDNEKAANAAVDAWNTRFSAGSATAEEFMGAMKDYFSSSQSDILNEANRQFDEAMNASLQSISDHYDRIKSNLDAQAEAMSATFDRRAKAFESRWDNTFERFDKRWDAKKAAVTAYYDARIAKVQAAIDAEKKAEDERQRIFEAEKQRIARMAEMYNRNIDISMALNSGNFDQAAKLSNDAQAAQESWLAADSAAASQSGSDSKVASMEKQIDNYNQLKDARLKALADQEVAEKKALEAKKQREQEAFEAEKKRYEKSMEIRKKAADQQAKVAEAAARREWEANKRALDMEMQALLAYVPRNQKELQDHIKVIEGRYAAYGVNLKANGNAWSKHIADVLRSNMKTATAKMSSDIGWAKLGTAAAQNFTQGAFGMSVTQFMKWIETGQAPASAQKKIASQERRYMTGGGKSTSYHSGGIIGKTAGSRVGFAGKNQSQSEVTINALKGEAVLNRKATRSLGNDLIERANRGEIPFDTGGPDYGIGGPDLNGLQGLAAGLLGGILRGGLKSGIMAAAGNKIERDMGTLGDFSATAGKPGRYGNTFLSSAQLGNAATIASVGRSVGASNRDIIIALMTAMQESMLRNIAYGDRDSVGLFQQRSGWGSFKDRMNPRESAKMFFLGGHQGQRGLLDFPNRTAMSLTQAAQAVQVSAFPNAYAKWQDEAYAIMKSMQIVGSGGGITYGAGGWLMPVNGRETSPYGMRVSPTTGQYRLHAGVDLGVPMGTPVKAAKSGRVSFSGTASGYGNYIMVDHGNGISTAYAHESRRIVRTGQAVGRGQVLGYSGTAGTGPHLHFEYLRNGRRVNPNLIFPGLREGGFTMSDGLANLHAGEAVLTKPLTEQLVNGVQSLDNSNHSAYNVVMDFRHSVISKNVDMQDAVENALLAVERRRGRNRTVK